MTHDSDISPKTLRLYSDAYERRTTSHNAASEGCVMSNQDLVKRAVECFGDSSRREKYFDLYSDDAVVHGYQGIGPGRANIERFYEEFWRVFPDARVVLEEIVEQGNSVAIRYTITGTLREAFLGVPPHRAHGPASRSQLSALP